MAAKFQFGESDDEGDLPFPEPLPRSAFLNPDFSPTELLSSLTSRHQTLYDLRAELSSRSQTIASELLTLVNNEYQAFLGLGRDLRGGGDKVDEIKVGVLAYQKGVKTLRDVVASRRNEVDHLVKERESIQDDIGLARAMLMISDQVEDLEEALSLGEKNQSLETWSDDESDSDDHIIGSVSVGRLKRLVHTYVVVHDQIDHLGSDQPFLKKLSERIRTIRQTLLIDLGTALKQAKGQKGNAGSRMIHIMNLYSDMDAVGEALDVLKK